MPLILILSLILYLYIFRFFPIVYAFPNQNVILAAIPKKMQYNPN